MLGYHNSRKEATLLRGFLQIPGDGSDVNSDPETAMCVAKETVREEVGDRVFECPARPFLQDSLAPASSTFYLQGASRWNPEQTTTVPLGRHAVQQWAVRDPALGQVRKGRGSHANSHQILSDPPRITPL